MIRAAEALAAIASLPIRPAATLLDRGPPLILAPHPDDESLGCGGLIAESVALGSPAFVIVLTDGTGSHPNSRAYPAPKLRRLREREAQAATAALGLKPDRIAFLGLPDTQSPVSGPAFEAAVTAVSSLAMRLGAGLLLTPWRHDPHCDHESAHLIGRAAAAETRVQQRAYPVWGLTLPPETPLSGNLPTGCRIDVTQHLNRKRAAIAAHRSQYAGLIVDDPQAFQMTPTFMALFDAPYEAYLDVD